MELVRDRKVWCPQTDEIQFRNCPDPPKFSVLYEIFKEVVSSSGKNMGLDPDDKHVPDKNWMLVIIATLNPDHALFQKDYVPPKTEQEMEAIQYVRNEDNFWSGLPKLYKTKDIKAKHVTAILSKEDRLQAKIQKAERQQAKKDSSIAKMKAELED